MTIELAQDFRDLLQAFVDRDVRFLVVGAYALAIHGRPRATGDLDVWVEPSPDNAQRAYRALGDFGAPLHELVAEDLANPGLVFEIGLPPLRIDVLTRITGVDFEPAWERRIEADFEGVSVPVLGREDLLRNKRATGRTQDRPTSNDSKGSTRASSDPGGCVRSARARGTTHCAGRPSTTISEPGVDSRRSGRIAR